MAFTRDWSETAPIDHTKFKVQPGGVRDLRTDISDRIKNFIYGFTVGETDIGVKSLPIITQGTAAPSTAANYIYLYGNDVAAKVRFTLSTRTAMSASFRVKAKFIWITDVFQTTSI